jgi:hypothetical protein
MVREVLKKIHLRLVKLASKKSNPLLEYFVDQSGM